MLSSSSWCWNIAFWHETARLTTCSVKVVILFKNPVKQVQELHGGNGCNEGKKESSVYVKVPVSDVETDFGMKPQEPGTKHYCFIL